MRELRLAAGATPRPEFDPDAPASDRVCAMVARMPSLAAPDLADPMALLNALAELAARARGAGWTVNVALEAAPGGGRLHFSAGREG